MRQRRLQEMVTVTVGAIGVPATGIGIVPVMLNLDEMDELAIGRAMADGFRAAHTEALREFGPKLSEAWAADPVRLREGDDEPEMDDGPGETPAS